MKKEQLIYPPKAMAVAELNLSDGLSPVCLLKIKNALKTLKSGEVLDIILNDPSIVKDLITIIGRSDDQIVGLREEKDCYHISIRKG